MTKTPKEFMRDNARDILNRLDAMAMPPSMDEFVRNFVEESMAKFERTGKVCEIKVDWESMKRFEAMGK